MKVCIIDVDSKLPNLALMKISNFHKKKGNIVKWFEPFFDQDADIIYISKIFTFTPDHNFILPNCKILKGGSGYNLKTKLSDEMEICDPDYSIYLNCKMSLQYYSRGCVRNCSFCIVREKEGYICAKKPMKLNPDGNWIHVLDNNFFASPEWENSINHLLSCNQKVKFDGIDIRMLTKKQSIFLDKIKLKTQIHIAWDNSKDDVLKHIKRVLNFGTIKAYKFMCYVLVGYNTGEDDDLFRIEELRKLKIDPFVMKYNNNKKDKYLNKLARWCNRKELYNSVSWEEYNGTN